MRKEIIFVPFGRWVVYLNRYAQSANALPVWMHPYVASRMHITGESCTIICILYSFQNPFRFLSQVEYFSRYDLSSTHFGLTSAFQTFPLQCNSYLSHVRSFFKISSNFLSLISSHPLLKSFSAHFHFCEQPRQGLVKICK